MATDVGPIRGYRDLRVWQRSMDLVADVYRLTQALPVQERYGLTSQMRRSAISIPSNIAEGRGRRGVKSLLYHLSVANGSLMELETQLQIGTRLGLLGDAEASDARTLCWEVGRLLAGLIRALRRPRPLKPDP